jgi:hypothetical protein
LKETPAHLESMLLFPMDEPFVQPTLPIALEGDVSGSNWKVYNTDRYALSIIEKGSLELNPIYEKGFHPFRLVWGSTTRTRTFVCQGGSARDSTFAPAQVLFSYEGEVEEEDREEAREAIFYFDECEGTEFYVSGKKSSTFVLGDEVAIQDKDLRIALTFTLEKGEGRFLGHRMPGNRPSQCLAKGASRYDAYDWQVFLRTIHREGACKVRAAIIIEEVQQ